MHDDLRREWKKSEDEVRRLRLERDVLALNQGKDSPVQVIWNGPNIQGVWWPDEQTASERLVRLPRWYENKVNE